MKIIKISQAIPISQTQISDLMEAFDTIQRSVATMNQAIQVIENSGIQNLFNRAGLIEAIQSGEINALDINKINEVLAAMTRISQTIPIVNSALKEIQANNQIAGQFGINLNSIQQQMIQSLNSGDYSQFTGILSGFQQQLTGLSGTISNTVGS